MKAAIRYFCLVLPNSGPQPGFDYLDALDKTGLGVKACPIGPAFFMDGAWPGLMHLFLKGELDSVFVNVICAPPNLSMGQQLKTSDMRPSREDNLPGVPPAQKEEILYRPQTALAGLYTVGVPNIAITWSHPKPPDSHEVCALSQYDAILVPTPEDAEALNALGLTVFCAPPDPAALLPILKALTP